MKIDLHCHTKKTKKGDPETRNVSKEKFVNVLSNYGISIVAITNHNYFSIEEYNSYKDECDYNGIQLWPGIELDVNIEGEHGHILLIADPNEVLNFSNLISKILNNKLPDDFCIEYTDLCSNIKGMDLVLIAHWALQKEHGFSDKAIEAIKNKLENTNPILLEPSKLKSVGIMAANGYEAFIGSDVRDWNKYPGEKIPSLKLKIKDFRTFKLLLKKDRNIIESFINQKTVNYVNLAPFVVEGDTTQIELPIYNDINIVFGGKATGKSKIIDALYDYYKNNGKNSVIAYYKASDNVETYKEITKREISESMFEKFNISDCSSNIDFIKKYIIKDLPTTSSFFAGMKSEKAKGKISKFGFFKASYAYVDDLTKYNKMINDLEDVEIAISKLKKDNLNNYIEKEKIDNLYLILNELKEKILNKAKNEWIDNKAKYLTKWLIQTMMDIGKIKSGEQASPPNTGLCEFYSSLRLLENNATELYENFSTTHKSEQEFIGNLPEKFDIYECLEYYLNPEEKDLLKDNKDIKKQFQKGKPTISELKKAYKAVEELASNVYKTDCGKELKKFTDAYKKINSLKDCFAFKAYVAKKDGDYYTPYNPSDGEKSMLQLAHAISDSSKEIFILDEPELSVGHNYINNNIVPRLIELGKLDKTIIISTHDANIAVRTLPINSIYREYKKTFIGNLFYDKLICKETKEECEWTQKSLDYLEGGKNAFIERGDSYGI